MASRLLRNSRRTSCQRNRTEFLAISPSSSFKFSMTGAHCTRVAGLTVKAKSLSVIVAKPVPVILSNNANRLTVNWSPAPAGLPVRYRARWQTSRIRMVFVWVSQAVLYWINPPAKIERSDRQASYICQLALFTEIMKASLENNSG